MVDNTSRTILNLFLSHDVRCHERECHKYNGESKWTLNGATTDWIRQNAWLSITISVIISVAWIGRVIYPRASAETVIFTECHGVQNRSTGRIMTRWQVRTAWRPIDGRERTRESIAIARDTCEHVCVCVYIYTYTRSYIHIYIYRGWRYDDACEETRVRFARARRTSFRLESFSFPPRPELFVPRSVCIYRCPFLCIYIALLR